MNETREATGWFLDVRGADGRQSRVPLAVSPVLIGRAADAHVLLESTAVSRQHAQLSADEQGRWWIRDLGSRNGTLVNGQLVKEQQVRPGDQIQVGGFVLTPVGPASQASDAPSGTVSGTGLLVSDDASRLSTLRDMEPPRVAAGHLTTLNDLSRDLLVTEDPRGRAVQLCRLMVSPQFHGQWAMILRLRRDAPDDPPEPLCEPQRAARRVEVESPHISRSLLKAVVRQGEAVLASNVQLASPVITDVQMSMASGVMALAAVACPLRQDARGVEVLYVTLPPQCGTSEWLALASLAAKQYQQAEQAWAARTRAADHAALERELERARQIQMRLVPKPAALAQLRGRGVDVAVGFAPSHYVGGDYVDALMMRDGRVLLAVGDVCGHGLAAALVTSAVHTLVHAAVRAGADLRTMTDGLNQHLCETLPGDSFVTFVALALDPASGAIECVNAGHPPPIVSCGDAPVRSLASGSNLPMGLDAAPLAVEHQALAPGEVLMVYSDGLSEQSDGDGQLLGIAGLKAEMRALCRTGGRPAEELAARLGEFIAGRRGGRLPEDDQSFVLARLAGD